MASVSKNSLLFNSDGSLTHDGQKACSLMHVDPKTLKVVTEAELISQGLEAHIAKVRADHFHEKRTKRI